MAILTKPFSYVPKGEFQPVLLRAGEKCPQEHEEVARKWGCFDEKKPDNSDAALKAELDTVKAELAVTKAELENAEAVKAELESVKSELAAVKAQLKATEEQDKKDGKK